MIDQMDFREHQDAARKNSNKIWMLYAGLLLISSFLTGMLFTGYLVVDGYVILWSEEFFITSAQFGVVALGILIISTLIGFFRTSDGVKVAKEFNGVEITHDGVNDREDENATIIQYCEDLKETDPKQSEEILEGWQDGSLDFEDIMGRQPQTEIRDLTKNEKRALNILEELSLAAAIKVPPLYLIPDNAINAFAAGNKPENAVVGITRGSLDTFDRKEMTGIIAHELGHIVSGDVKINIRVSSLVFGFTVIFLVGRWMLNSAIYSRSDARAKIIKMALAAGLMAVGLITVFFGKVLQAAMSRQREYLADASAIQFTRHPDGLNSAFKKLQDATDANTKIESEFVENFSHAFIFGIGGELMATHPPLQDRMDRLNKRVI